MKNNLKQKVVSPSHRWNMQNVIAIQSDIFKKFLEKDCKINEFSYIWHVHEVFRAILNLSL